MYISNFGIGPGAYETGYNAACTAATNDPGEHVVFVELFDESEVVSAHDSAARE